MCRRHILWSAAAGKNNALATCGKSALTVADRPRTGIKRKPQRVIKGSQSAWRRLRRRSSGWLFATACCRHGLVGPSMRNAGTRISEPSFLKIPSFPIFSPPLNVGGR